MNSPVVRLVIAALVVIVIFAGALYSSHEGGVNRKVRVPEKSIHTIPMEMDGWTAKEVEIDEKLFRGVAAYEVFSRNYTNPTHEENITLHCASFNSFWRRVPHSPKVCYPANGWTIISDEPFELEDPDGRPATARLATFEKNGETIYVLFWFQFGDYVVTNAAELSDARWVYRDDETWPPVVKMMLQIPADHPQRAKDCLREFANQLHTITRTFK